MFRNVYHQVGNKIYVKASNPEYAYSRITNTLLWELNTYFKLNGDVLEYYFGSRRNKSSLNETRIPCWSLLVPRMLYIEDLDKMFIDRVVLSDEQLQIDYRSWKDECGEIPFDAFIEYNSIETLVALTYIVTEKRTSLKSHIDHSLKTYRSTRKLKRLLVEDFDAHVSIEEHGFMEITINKSSLMENVLDIIQRNCEVTESDLHVFSKH